MSAHSAGAYTATLLVRVNVMRGGGRAPPSLTSQKAAVATLCTLWHTHPVCRRSKRIVGIFY